LGDENGTVIARHWVNFYFTALPYLILKHSIYLLNPVSLLLVRFTRISTSNTKKLLIDEFRPDNCRNVAMIQNVSSLKRSQNTCVPRYTCKILFSPSSKTITALIFVTNLTASTQIWRSRNRSKRLQFRILAVLTHSVIKTSQLMLYSEIIAVCSQIHTGNTNTLCGQNVEFCMVMYKMTTLT
jgi:hypothetical protein